MSLEGQKIAAAPIEQAIQRYLRVDEVCLFSGLSEQGHEVIIVAIQSDRRIQKSQLEAAARDFIPCGKMFGLQFVRSFLVRRQG